jgi:hypothetical protein
MEKLQKCVNFILTVPVFFATSCTKSCQSIILFNSAIIKTVHANNSARHVFNKKFSYNSTYAVL